MRLVIIYLIGVIFGLGIMISGMANPAKVINFFDLAGNWDPSLMFVMGGALLVTFLGYRVIFKRPVEQPLMGTQYHLPTNTKLDFRLIGGSVIFGIGWGVAGFCPGGALPAIGTFNNDVIVFTASLIVGILVAKGIQSITNKLSDELKIS